MVGKCNKHEKMRNVEKISARKCKRWDRSEINFGLVNYKNLTAGVSSIEFLRFITTENIMTIRFNMQYQYWR